MTAGNRYAYTIFTDNGLIVSWGARNIFSFHAGPCKKIVEKHCSKPSSIPDRISFITGLKHALKYFFSVAPGIEVMEKYF